MRMENMRRCPRCDTEKPVTEFRRNSITGTFSPYCKPCTSAYKKQRYAESPKVRAAAVAAGKRRQAEKGAEIKAYQDAYREANRARINAQVAEHRNANRDAINAARRGKKVPIEQKERVEQRRRLLMATDPEFRARKNAVSRKASRVHYRKHRKSVLEVAKEKYWSDPDRARAITRASVAKWYADHPEQAAANQAKRRAMRRGAQAEGFDDVAH